MLAGCPDEPAELPADPDPGPVIDNDTQKPDPDVPAGCQCDDGFDCTVDTCDDNGDCQHDAKDFLCADDDQCNGVETCDLQDGCQAGAPLECDDGDVCTGEESCNAAAGCVSGPSLECDDGLPCNGDETCDPQTGCAAGRAPAGCCDGQADCDNGNPCDGVETCNSDNKTCQTGTPMTCDDGDVCNGAETCDAVDGCVSGDAIVCDDGDPCTGVETCDAVDGCQAAAALECDDADPCNGTETCLAGQGCQSGQALDCNDGDACNGAETCLAGQGCQAGAAPQCDDGNACNGVETCSAVDGCQAGEALECSDDNVCNGAETCDAATGCVAGEALECDDADLCNGAESCSPDAGCQSGEPLVCDDGDPCTGAETCDALSGCAAGEPLVCDNDNPCDGVETCLTLIGCQNGTAPVCNDGKPCNGEETCNAEGCQPGTPPAGCCQSDADCNDSDVCNGSEICDLATATCLFGKALACDNANPCDGQEWCHPAAGCKTGAALICSDGDPCNGIETCLEGDGCQPALALVCDDQDVCNGVETCVQGVGCQAGDALGCDNGDECDGLETCNAKTGCVQGTALACDDGLPCNGEESCATGQGCIAGTPPDSCCSSNADCNDKLACNGAEICDPETNACVLGDAIVCSDGNACNGLETCDNAADGACENGIAPECDDGELCTTDSCDGQLGCVNAFNALGCNDDNACTDNDTCADGACAPGTAAVCDDTDGCTADTCDALLGCQYTIDLTPPQVVVEGVANGATAKGPVTPTVTTQAGFATALTATLNEAPYELGTEIAGNGDHTLVVTATGCDGKDVQLTVAFTLDDEPPVLEAVLVPLANTNGWNNTPVTVNFVATDEHSKIVTVTQAVVLSDPGAEQLVTGTAVDAAGNETTVSVLVSIDFKAPTVTLTEPKPNQLGNDQLVTSQTSLTFKGTISEDALSGFGGGQITSTKLAKVTTFDAPGPFEVTLDLKPGMNSVVVGATDMAGNAASSALMVFVDNEPPVAKIQSPSHGYKTTETSLDVTGFAHDLVIGSVTDEDVAVIVNGVPAKVVNGQFIAKAIPLNLGQNIIQAVATDSVGLSVVSSITVTRVSDNVTHLKLVSGSDQTASIMGIVDQPLVVQLLDAAGSPVADHDVLFAVTSSDGELGHPLAASVSANSRMLLAKTDAAGLAEANYQLGTRAGAGLDQVTVSAPGAVSSITFLATATSLEATNIHPHAGMNQLGRPNTAFPEPLSVIVSDAGGNKVANQPVTFTVEEGDGLFGGQKAVTVVTNTKGFADVVFTPGEDIGYATHVVRATIPVSEEGGSLTEQGASFVLSVFPKANTIMTGVRGSVLDEDGAGLAGVTVRFPGFAEEDLHTVKTDANGAFTFMDAPKGHVLLEIDGRTAVPEDAEFNYPKMTFEVHLQEGVVTELPGPVYMLKLNQGQFVDGLFDVEFTLPEAPGFKLTVPAGTSVLFPDGSEEGVISVTQVHFDQAPMAPSDGLQSRLLVTIQPPGVRFDPPSPLQLPNVDGYPPGKKVDMFSYDHDIEAFVPIGTGQVSDDGTVVRSDPGVGVVKGGWHCGAAPAGSGSSSSLTAKLSVEPPKDPEVEGGFTADKDPKEKGGTKWGIGGGGTYAIPPSGPAKLKAGGSPGKDAHWEWCGSGDISVSGPSCAGETSCEGTATPTNPSEGALGKARVLHICDETKECVQDTIDVVICDVPLNKKEFSINAEKALPLGKWANIFKGWAEKLGCDFGCAVHCKKGKACGDSCIAKTKKCTWPPGVACDPGQTSPLKVKGSLKITNTDLCCPGCPATVETNTDVAVSAELGFAGDCNTPWGKNIKVAGFKLKIGLFVDFGMSLSGFVGAQIDNCCATPPCWCAKGGIGVTFTLGGSLKAILDAPSPSGGLNLVTATAGIGTGVQAKVDIDCDKLCGTFGTLPVKAKVVFTVWNGMITILKKEFEILPAFTHGPDCVNLDLSVHAPKAKKGCPTTPPVVPEPSCACP